MDVELSVRDLLLASWPVAEQSVARALPEGLRPGRIDGRSMVTLASFRVESGRIGRLRMLPFSQLNVRTYTSWAEEPAVFFFLAAVTAGGLPGVLLRAPYRPARIRVATGRLEAPGLGVSLGYRLGEAAEPGALGRHELGLFRRPGGLGAFRIHRGAAEWRRAEIEGASRADVLVARGFDAGGEPELLYAGRTSFAAELPRRIASTSSSWSSA